ncbi:STY4851/ECs_5259 family protein [Sphingobium aromaticivastans]|uniref:STY4851/ECs_5259 family protein n=1 Tax=Sphingobium aromaticivastans TaxID=1778665 RepID=UPI00301AE4FA
MLQADVAALAVSEALDKGNGPGLFVLWAADWFRRRYRGDGLQWDSLAQALGRTIDHAFLRTVTEKGLRLWRRPFKTNQRGRYFLGTLAREGGFPVAAIELGGKGWAAAMLAGIVAPLLADPAAGRKQAEAFARARQGRITARLFQDEEFALLCAEMALAIVAVRREADGPARAAGLPVAAWLQLHRPAWREELPFSVSGPGADALLGELLLVEAAGVSGIAVGVERLLVRGTGGTWYEAARLGLDGRIDGSVVREIGGDIGRLRLFAAGALGRDVPGELGMLEPPADGESGWAARSRLAMREILPVPFATAIEMDVRSGERWIGRIAWPQGKARRGLLLVCSVAAGTDEMPEQLKVEGSGSGLFRAEALVLQVPADWTVTTAADGLSAETVTMIGPGVGDTLLWTVTGGAFVTAPDGDCYRIRAGQARDSKDRLDLVGDTPHWAEVSGDVDLYLGPPMVRAGDAVRGGLFIRDIGAREWRKAPAPLPVGHYDIGWREGRLLLDRRRIAVLPATARLERSGVGAGTRYSLSGFGDVTLTPAEDAPVRVVNGGWVSRPPGSGQPRFRFDAMVGWQNSRSLPVTIGYPAAAAIARWDGTLLRGGATITLADLRDLVAVDRGEMRLFGELVDKGVNGAASAMTWQFHGDMPISSVATDITSLLLPGSIDASVRLGMLDGIETYWHVRPFALRLLKQTGGGLVASEAIVTPDVMLCGRSLAEPGREVCFGAYSLLVDANHRPFTLPPELGGTWLVYLRAKAGVLSRPELVQGEGVVVEPQTALTKAMQVAPWAGLDTALTAVLDAARDEDAIVTELVRLVVSLDGLAPSTFGVLRLLPENPLVLARMAFSAAPDERDAVLALSDALPFGWCLLPRTAWEQAFHARLHGLVARMQGIDGAMRFAMEANAAVLAALADREPLLEHVLKEALSTVTRDDANQAFLRVASDRLPAHRRESRYRMFGLVLPDDHLRLPDHCLETLDAPYAAALAVRGDWTPDAEAVRHLKAVARAFPLFFADAFAAALKETR